MKYLILLLFLTLIPIVTASDLSYNPNLASNIDIANSTYLTEIINSPTSDFPLTVILSGIMHPITNAFSGIGVNSGSIVFLIIFGIFVMMVWRQSGKVTIPCMITIITAGFWGIWLPESSYPWIQILIVIALAAQGLSWISRE